MNNLLRINKSLLTTLQYVTSYNILIILFNERSEQDFVLESTGTTRREGTLLEPLEVETNFYNVVVFQNSKLRTT